MSYLTLPGGIDDFKRAVISFWFRVPQQSIDTLRSRSTNEFRPPRPRLAGVMPLMTFGKLFDANRLEPTYAREDASYSRTYWQYNGFEGGDGWHPSPSETSAYSSGQSFEKGDPNPLGPCFVGIYYDEGEYAEDETKEPYLKVSLQTSDKGAAIFLNSLQRNTVGPQNHGVVVGTSELQNAMSAWNFVECETNSTAPGNPWISVSVLEDASEQVMGVGGPDRLSAGSKAMKISSDQWHHVLLSFDLKPGSTTGIYATRDGMVCGPPIHPPFTPPSMDGPSKIWIALDDVNYTGADLRGVSDYQTQTESPLQDALGANGFISNYAAQAYYNIVSETHDRYWVTSGCVTEHSITGGKTPSYRYPANPLPTNGQPFGIPAADNMVEKILRVEMAEFMMWTGDTIDTASADNRRAFIDEDGKPVPPDQQEVKDDDGHVTQPPGSIQLIGRKPDIMLHNSSNWIAGANTGASGIDEDGEIIPGGQLTPKGGIARYTPDPKLGA